MARSSDAWDVIVWSAARDNLRELPWLNMIRRKLIPPLDPDHNNPQINSEILASAYEKQFSPHFPSPNHRALVCKYTHDETSYLLSGQEFIIFSMNVLDKIKTLKTRVQNLTEFQNSPWKYSQCQSSNDSSISSTQFSITDTLPPPGKQLKLYSYWNLQKISNFTMCTYSSSC